MNNKENKLQEILGVVVECTTMEIDGEMTITEDDIRGRSRLQNINMARCIFVSQAMFTGYSTTTIAKYLHRTEPAIRHMLDAAHQFKISSYAYRIAEAEVTIKCRDLMEQL